MRRVSAVLRSYGLPRATWDSKSIRVGGFVITARKKLGIASTSWRDVRSGGSAGDGSAGVGVVRRCSGPMLSRWRGSAQLGWARLGRKDGHGLEREPLRIARVGRLGRA